MSTAAVPDSLNRRTRLFHWLNDPEDPHWERPGPTRAQRRNDVLGMVLALAVGLLMVMFAKSFGARLVDEAAWRAYLAVALMVLPLAIRRAFPLITLVVASVLFLALSYLSPEAAVSLTFQVAYFTALYSAVAWARDRRALWILNVLVIAEMAVWLTVSFTLTNAFSGEDLFEDAAGPMAALPAYLLHTAVMNFAYFVGAMLIGRNSWRGALERGRADAHARQLAEQAEELARRAVVDERIRIARELHDVVAHHVSVIGIQAGAARRVMNHSAEQAALALRTVESASREAVTEMRSLLKVLRSDAGEDHGDGTRLPEPNLADVEALAGSHAGTGLQVSVNRVEHSPGALAQVPAPLALSAYRCIQESLTNVNRHSTATTAQVTIRTGGEGPKGWLEVEILDAGRPRPDTSGTGYGLRGITERATLHQGVAEVGPRAHHQGWRVRVRFPVSRQQPVTGAAGERTLA
ncbi:sensor histidine kinase [Ruania zhangjianzhongii]|uniref:sensor histidine kinase n=1 Tax=Ruania zhangjianzhongii TaxID=2603206 RepID=UPI0011C8ABE8|nr:histidine kinase [Ruania zhangjianzhongii]